MTIKAAELLLDMVALYLCFGVLFGLFLECSKKLEKMDPAVKGATAGFKLIVFPGLVLLWPVFFVRWLKEKGK